MVPMYHLATADCHNAGLFPREVRKSSYRGEGSMHNRVGLGKYEEVGRHLFGQIWWPVIIVFTLLLNMAVPVTLAVAADSPNLVGKWKGTYNVVVTTPRIVNQRMSAPAELEITEVAEDGAAFKGTMTFYSAVQKAGTRVVKLDGQIENGVLKAKLGQEALLELSPRGDALAGKIIRSEHDAEDISLKRVDGSPTK